MERIVTIKKMLPIVELLPADPPVERQGVWYLTQQELMNEIPHNGEVL